jgi:hypothetical protein
MYWAHGSHVAAGAVQPTATSNYITLHAAREKAPKRIALVAEGNCHRRDLK